MMIFALGCASPVAPDANGQWGGNQAALTLTSAGGKLTMQCGTAKIDSTWTLTSSGEFNATGATYGGGGPDPVGGRPPNPARFVGHISGATFTIAITVLSSSGSALGPFLMKRNGPQISQLCL